MRELSTLIISILVIALLVKLLNLNKSKNNNEITPTGISCKSVFYAKLPDGTTHNFHTQDMGFQGGPSDIKYFKNDVVLNAGGVVSATADVEITKSEFDSACKYLYNPPYPWYTNKSDGGNTNT